MRTRRDARGRLLGTGLSSCQAVEVEVGPLGVACSRAVGVSPWWGVWKEGRPEPGWRAALGREAAASLGGGGEGRLAGTCPLRCPLSSRC